MKKNYIEYCLKSGEKCRIPRKPFLRVNLAKYNGLKYQNTGEGYYADSSSDRMINELVGSKVIRKIMVLCDRRIVYELV